MVQQIDFDFGDVIFCFSSNLHLYTFSHESDTTWYLQMEVTQRVTLESGCDATQSS